MLARDMAATDTLRHSKTLAVLARVSSQVPQRDVPKKFLSSALLTAKFLSSYFNGAKIRADNSRHFSKVFAVRTAGCVIFV
jgi:hypothetical protein